MPFFGLVLLGLLASGFTGPLPGYVRFLIALSVLTWVPGALFTGSIVPGWARGPLERFVLWFSAGLAAVSLLTWISLLAGLPFDVYTVCVQWLLALYFAISLAGGTGRGGGEEPPGRAAGGTSDRLAAGYQRTLVTVAVVLVALALANPVRLNLGQDAPDHIGYIRHIAAENSLEPQGVLAPALDAGGAPAAVPGPDPRKGTIHPVIALAARLSAVDPETAWPLYGIFMLPVAFLSFCWFCAPFLPRPSLVFVCGVLFLLFQGGIGFLYSAEAANGRNLALKYYWVLVPLCLAYLAVPRRRLLGFLVVVLAGGALAHVGVAMHVVVLLGTLLVFHRWLGFSRRAVLTLCAWGGGVAAVLLVWKITHDAGTGNLIHTHPNRLMFVGHDWFVVSPFYVLRRHGMIFLGGLLLIPFLLAAWRDRSARMGVAWAAIPLLLCFVPPVTVLAFRFATYMTFRSLLNVPVFACAVAAVYLLAVWARRRGWVVRAGVSVVLIAWSFVFLTPAFNGLGAEVRVRREQMDSPSVWERHADLIEFMRTRPDGSVVLSDPKTSYLLSAATTHRVVAVNGPHGNPHDPFALERLSSIRDVLSPYVLQSATITACERFGVDFVVVNSRLPRSTGEFMLDWDPGLFDLTKNKLDFLDTRFRPVFETEDCIVYVYYPGPVPPDEWYPEQTPVSFEGGHVHECLIQYPDLGVNIVEAMISPKVVLPGETVRITIGYYKQDAVEYGLPLNMYVRFDHQSIHEGTRHYPGEKYVRRWRERRGGYLLRYRYDRRPFGGVLTPDQWPIAVKFYETFDVRLPSALKTGRYRVEFKLERDSMIANFALSDLLYNRDHYSGTPCFEIEVARQVER